jgi:hypothetical protein
VAPDPKVTRLLVNVKADKDTNVEKLTELVRQLREKLLELDVKAVSSVRTAEKHEKSQAGAPVIYGGLLVTLGDSREVLAMLMGAIGDWHDRHQQHIADLLIKPVTDEAKHAKKAKVSRKGGVKLLRRLFHRGKSERKTAGGSVLIDHPSRPERQRRMGSPSAPPGWREAREQYYDRWFGSSESARVWHELTPAVPHIDVYIYPPSTAQNRNFFTLVTSGMSDEMMHHPKDLEPHLVSRAEIITYVSSVNLTSGQREKPWYVAMSIFAHFPFDYKTWLSCGHTVPNGQPPAPIVEGSELTTALFMRPTLEPSNFTNGLVLGNEKVNFLWLTFITDDECQYKLEHGFDALIGIFERGGFPRVLDPYRKSILKAR